MREEFIEKRFSPARLRLIGTANEIVEQYMAQGFRLTLRQLYYVFVTQNELPNLNRAYKMLGEAISDGRLAGLIDWEAIEDRVRVPINPPEFNGLEDLVQAALQSYRLPRWADQENYVELWVEKDALAGVLRPLAMEYHITLMVNRGYSSQSAMYEAGKRFIREGNADKECHLLYLGDMDPSGEDMVRDIQDRLERFGADVHVVKVALTLDQIETYKPPPNPAKLSDSRASAYISRHGSFSWEVDALKPEVLHTVIRGNVEDLLDLEKYRRVMRRETKDKAALARAVKGLKG